MLYLAVFFITLFCLFNAFFIGKLLKRINISINNYIATVGGFIILVVIMYITYILLYLVLAQVVVYVVFILGVQIVLFGLYVWNYRYAFISLKISAKPLISFATACICTIAICITMILTVYFKQDIYHSNLGSDD
jgi:hypothetical protein